MRPRAQIGLEIAGCRSDPRPPIIVENIRPGVCRLIEVDKYVVETRD
jgi:hypothetical protein